MKHISLLLIGFGPHARRIYYPIITHEQSSTGASIVCAVDLLSQQSVIEEYLSKRKETLPVYYLDKPDNNRTLPKHIQILLNTIVQKFNIQGIIISTEPLAHVGYANWALENGLSILMDKPISTAIHASVSEKAANQILDDYQFLKKKYLKAKMKDKHILFSLMAQRRYHPSFQKMKLLIQEVYTRTGCPVTSIQSFHSDGQWRLPSEIIDIDYHSYNQGYGKCSHTGYHALDIVPWLLEAAESKDSKINNVDIFTNFLRPNDFLSQIPMKNYTNLFPHFNKHNHYTEKEIRTITQNYGEIDAFNSFAFKHNDRTITLGSMNFVHNGFSQRGWMTPNADLYKGNGRVRHESHFIEQGPFQAISFISYQSDQIDPSQKHNIFGVGGEYHLDIHVFRNHNLIPAWKRYELFGIQNLNKLIVSGYSRGHQEDARRQAIIEFIHHLHKPTTEHTSHFLDHERGTILLAGVYQSAAKRFHHKNPIINSTL